MSGVDADRGAGRRTVVIAAGGTGGHVYPAIAVAEALVARGHARERVRFLTDGRDLTATAIARSGFAFEALPLQRGLQRKVTLANARVVVDACRSFGRALRALRRDRADVVVGFGAYVSLPVVAAARLLRIPTVVHEQNGFPGLANRIAVRLGARAAVSLPDTPLRGAVLTGNPVRASITQLERVKQEPPLVAFFGGSLGAAALNHGALALYDRWRDRRDLAIRHVTGERYLEACRDELHRLRRPEDHLKYALVGYEHDMAALYARASIMVMRAGGSVAEVAAAGVPSVLVPWPGATEDHQSANAAAFARAGAAVHLPEPACTAERLAVVLDELLRDAPRLAAMSVAARSLAHPDAADKVAALVEAALGR